MTVLAWDDPPSPLDAHTAATLRAIRAPADAPRWTALPAWTLLGEDPFPDAVTGDAVAWSGGVGDGLFGAHPRTWSPRTLDRAIAAAERLAPALARASTRLWIRPHARHALSDAPSITRFARALEGSPVGLLPDPAALLTAAMLPRADEHLERLAEHAGGLIESGRAPGVVLANVAAPAAGSDPLAPDDGPPLRPAPLHAGAIPLATFASAWRGPCAGPGRPRLIILPAGGEPEQLRALAGVIGNL